MHAGGGHGAGWAGSVSLMYSGPPLLPPPTDSHFVLGVLQFLAVLCLGPMETCCIL